MVNSLTPTSGAEYVLYFMHHQNQNRIRISLIGGILGTFACPDQEDGKDKTLMDLEGLEMDMV